MRESIWVGDPEFIEVENEVDLSSTSSFIPDPATCVPIYARSAPDGQIVVMFNHPIDLLVSEDDLMLEVMDSGTIQVQLVAAMEP